MIMHQRRAWSFSRLLAAGGVAVLSGAALPVVPAASAAVAALRLVPLSAGHVLAKGDLAQPPTTAECEADFGIACYQPFQLEKAYDADALYAHGITGRGKTIVIVDAFGSPNIQSDLATFDLEQGLPAPPSFHIIQPAGPVPPCTDDPFGVSDCEGWSLETSLDVEWSHSMAPGANILLVETPDSETEGVQGFPDIVYAENYVIDHHLGDVISQSFAATEETFPDNQSIQELRSAYFNAEAHNVTVLASTGDAGATDYESNLSTLYPYPVVAWPATDPLVTAMGGTQLHLNAAGNRTSPDVVWNDGYGAGGGGLSVVFSRPQFQDSVSKVVGRQRGVPDLSMSAAVNGGVDVLDTSPGWGGWFIVGGTSESSPLMAGVVALADQANGRDVGYLNPTLYKMAGHKDSGIVDITSGNNTFAGVTGFNAGPGYDLASGLGTIDVAEFVQALSGPGHHGHGPGGH